MHDAIVSARAEMHKMGRDQIIWLSGVMVALVDIIIAIPH